MLIVPITNTTIIVAATPKINNHVFCWLSNVNSESPAPRKTTAEERGSIPTKVPITNDFIGTRAAAIKKFVSAKGIAGDSRSGDYQCRSPHALSDQGPINRFRFWMRLKNVRESVGNKTRMDQERQRSRPYNTGDQNGDPQVETKSPTCKYANYIGREESKSAK
ncbi:MAG: hypothetical protein IPK98_18405 [Chloracidobacterium sp.]|nr:hypothetical protein [Chloracidobacterium sp.]